MYPTPINNKNLCVRRILFFAMLACLPVNWSLRPYHGQGDSSQTLSKGPFSVPAQSAWDLWWAKCHWESSASTSVCLCHFHSSHAPYSFITNATYRGADSVLSPTYFLMYFVWWWKCFAWC